MTASAVANVLGGQKALKRRVGTNDDLLLLVRRGLPVAVILQLTEGWPFNRTDLARAVGISPRTLSRRINSHGRMSAAESDRTVRLARVLAHAKETFGDMERASKWLQFPNLALGGKKPSELLDTDIGVQEVDTILGRIDYGLFS